MWIIPRKTKSEKNVLCYHIENRKLGQCFNWMFQSSRQKWRSANYLYPGTAKYIHQMLVMITPLFRTCRHRRPWTFRWHVWRTISIKLGNLTCICIFGSACSHLFKFCVDGSWNIQSKHRLKFPVGNRESFFHLFMQDQMNSHWKKKSNTYVSTNNTSILHWVYAQLQF